MKINEEALKASGNKLLFLVSERWQGLSPATTYSEQAEAVSRALDSVEYIERAIQQGDVVLAHKETTVAGTTQLVAVEKLEDLSRYLKSNEAHARLPMINRTVLPLSNWDEGRKVFDKMLARAQVRAEYEAKGLSQPNQLLLDQEAEGILAAKLASKNASEST